MTSPCYQFCQSTMDPCDGQRMLSCLGIAYLREDVDNPCSAACNLPREERLHSANKNRSSMPEHGKKSCLCAVYSNTLIDRVFNAAKIIGLQPPNMQPVSVGGIW